MSEIKRYRKKPVVIEAVQWDGTSGGASTIIDWIEGNEGCARYRCAPGGCTGTEEGHYVAIETLEGTVSASAGDFIIRGVQGEFYPCKPEIFEKTYEAVGQLRNHPERNQRMMSDFETMSRPAHVEANVIRVEFGVNCGDHAETQRTAIRVTREMTVGELLDNFCAFEQGGRLVPAPDVTLEIRGI